MYSSACSGHLLIATELSSAYPWHLYSLGGSENGRETTNLFDTMEPQKRRRPSTDSHACWGVRHPPVRAVSVSAQDVSSAGAFIRSHLAAAAPVPPLTIKNWINQVIWFNLFVVTATPLLSIYGLRTTVFSSKTAALCVAYYVWNMIGGFESLGVSNTRLIYVTGITAGTLRPIPCGGNFGTDNVLRCCEHHRLSSFMVP